MLPIHSISLDKFPNTERNRGLGSILDLKDPFFKLIVSSGLTMSLSFPLVPAIAQSDVIRVYGDVKDVDSGKRIAEVTVTATDTLDPAFVRPATMKRNGGFSVELPLARVYRIVFAAPGHVAKNVIIDTRGIPEKESKGGFGMNLVPTLPTWYPAVDYTLLKRPIGVARYDADLKAVVWDQASLEADRGLYEVFNKQYQAAKKAAEKR